MTDPGNGPGREPGAPEDAGLAFLVSSAAPSPGDAGPCPDENALAAFAEDGDDDGAGTPDASMGSLKSHLAACPACRALAAALVEERTAPEAEPRVPSPDARSTPRPGTITSFPRGGDLTLTSPPPMGAGEPPRAACGAEEPFPRAFGPFTLLRRLGAGGMGVVYEAVHRERRRPEALKVLPGDLGRDAALVERFRREMQAMGNTEHDHVVRLYDAGEVEGQLYYTMPMLPGASLGDVLHALRTSGETAPGERALRILDRFGLPPAPGPSAGPRVDYARRIALALAGVADALATLHARGLVHRDLKPANLMVDGSGRVLVADFGLVMWRDQRITRTGQSLGTPAYMSPEQVRGTTDTDGRTDVYALGATLYELLTLRLPHEGATVADTVQRKLTTPVPPVRAANDGVPEGLDALVGRCLEIRREDRIATAALLRDDLLRVARGEHADARPVSPTARLFRRGARLALPAGLAAAALAAPLLWGLTGKARISVSAVPAARLILDGEDLGTTPVTALAVKPGRHEVRLQRPKFRPWTRTVETERGGSVHLEPWLLPEDAADPESLRTFAAAAGVELSAVRVETTRSGDAGPPLTVLFPRGIVRAAPTTVRLWAPDPVKGWRIRLESADGALSVDVPPPDIAWERVDADLASAWATLAAAAAGSGGAPSFPAPGSAWRLRLVDPTGTEAGGTTFTILDGTAARDLEARLAALRRSVDNPDAADALRFLEIETLLRAGLHEEAYDRTVDLSDRLGTRPEIARTALAVLDAAGLRDRAWWNSWAEAYR